MAIPCKVTPKRGIAKALGLKENVSMSYPEWVEALSKATEKGDVTIDKNGNIEFSKEAAAKIKRAGLLDELNKTMGVGKETKVYTSENLDEIDSSGFNDLQKKVIGDIKNIVKAIDNLVKNVTGNKLSVNVHSSEAEYIKSVVNAGGTEAEAKSRGFYLGTDGTIHLNMNRVTSETMMHEAIHPILDYLHVNNSKVIDSLYKQLRGLEGGQEFTKRAAKLYKGQGALTIKKEALTDFIANIADGAFELTKSNYEKVRDFIYDMLKTLGIAIPEKYSDIRDIESLKELAKFISEGFAKGKEIKSVEVKKDNIEGEEKAKQMMSFSKTNYGESGISKDPALDSKEYDRALTDKIMPDGTPRIQVVNPKESLKDKKMMQTFPDDHFVGSIKYKNREVAYGNGGIFYVAKYGVNGGVWCSVSESTANGFAKNLNRSREINGGEGIVLLTKGDDLKHQTSLESVTGLLSTLLTAAEIEGKESYDSIVNVVKQLYDIHGNTKNSQAVKKFFDEYLTGGRAESGQTMKNAKEHFETMMTKLTTQSNAAVTNILRNMGFEGERYFDKTGLKKGKYKVTNKGLKNFFIDVFSEDALSGVQAGEVYGAIKVYSDVKTAPKDNLHPSYPYPIVTVDGSPVKLEIFDRTFPAYGDNVALKGRQSESKSAYGNASFTTPIYTIDPSKISDTPTRTEKIEQYESVKRTQKPAAKGKIQASRIVENDKVAETYVEPHMTESEDGKDYVFFHVSNADPKQIAKGIDSRKFYTLATSKQEKATQYGVASYYTKPEDSESMVSGNKYVVRVPKDKVYPMDLDPNNYREKALGLTPEGTPFRSEVVKKKMAEMAAKDGYQMAVGEWSFDRKGEVVKGNEFRADALVPLRPTKESPDSYQSNMSKGMERVPHPQQAEYLRGKQLEDLAEKVYSHYSSKNKYGEAYQIANSIRIYGGIMENLNTPNERVRPLTKEEFDIMTKGLPPELTSIANNIKFSKDGDVNETMKDWVVSQFKSGIGEEDLVEVLKDYGLSDKEAADTVAAAVESLNEPTKAQKNKQRADSVNPFLNYTPDETGVQNMVATLERIQAGKEPIEIDQETKRDWKTVMQRAKDFFLNPNNSIDNLIQDLRDGKAPTAEDVAVMTMHKVDLDRQMAEALEQRAKLVAEGNPNFIAQDVKISEISSRLEEYYEAARRSAYEQGLAFGIRKMMLANDYSIGNVLRRVNATGDKAIPTQVVKKLESLSAKIKEQTDRILELEDQLAKEKASATIETIINNKKAPTQPTPEKSRVEKAIKAIESIRERLKNKTYSDATGIVAAIDTGLMVIEKSLKAGLSVSRAIEKGVKAINKAMKGAKWDEESFRKDVTEGFINEGVDIDKTEISELGTKDGKLEITRGYLETLVENGYDTIDKMVDYIKGTEAGEKFTEREIMDSISGYGETEYPPADKISEKISIAKGEGKALAALADVVSGMLPKKSGFQRRQRTDRERRLLQETRQKLKAFPEDAEKSAKSWASALDRMKSAYKNRIADLEKAMKEGKKIFREKRETKLDDEAKMLKSQKEELQAVYDKMFAPEIKSNIEKLSERAAELTKEINNAKKNNDSDAERKAQIEKDLTEGVISDLKSAAKANRTEQEKKLEQIKTRLKTHIETLNKKIDGTYEEKSKIDVTLDQEAIDLEQERDQLKAMLDGLTSRQETDAEKAERLTSYYEKQVAQLEADIDAMDVGYKVRSAVTPTPEMKRVKDKLDNLRKIRDELREQLGLAYQRDIRLAEKRNERIIKDLENKKQAVINGTYKPKVKKEPVTSRLIQDQKKQKAALENEIEQIIADQERANRGRFKKIVDSTSEVFRASVLSGIATIEKLMGYGILESHIIQPIQGLVVGQATRAIPYINRINKMAGGRMTLGIRAEAKKAARGFAEFWSKDTWKDTAKLVKTGKSELDLLWGDYKVTHPEIGAWVGHMHKALKNPTLRANFVRHMEGNLVYQAEVLGMDINDPATVEAAARASLIEAYSDILLNKNWLSNQWNGMIRGAELMGKKDNEYLKKTGTLLAGILKIFEPVTGVPVNAANRLASYYPPIGLIRALGGITVNKMAGKKPEDMTKQEAADIIRNIKAAGTGALFYAIGYMFPEIFGGSDDDEEEFRNKSGLKKGEFAFMPKAAGHHPAWEIAQIGATDRRIDDSGKGTASKKLGNYIHLQYEYVENTPFFDFPITVKEAIEQKGGGSRVVGGVLRNLTTPMLVQQLSKYMDSDSEGNPINRGRDGFIDELKYGIYPFRKDLPVKGGLMIKESDRKYFEDINFYPKLDKKTDDKFTLKGKQVITDQEYDRYVSNVNSDFNMFVRDNIDNLKYRVYSTDEEKEINKDLVEEMNPAEINIDLERKKKSVLTRAKAAIESKYTAEYQYSKNIITKSVYDREIKSSDTELENISDWINENYKKKKK
jgi:hypothetical protein